MSCRRVDPGHRVLERPRPLAARNLDDFAGFNAFRGTAFLPEPCAGYERREVDFGGCRCQAFLLTGDARAVDPVCHLSPAHGLVATLAGVQEDKAYDYLR